MSVYLRRIQFLWDKVPSSRINSYPFNIPAIQTLEELDITHSVTIFVGENGSGKSTLLEAIAEICHFHPAGGSRSHYYNFIDSPSDLSQFIRLSWFPKITNGFFLRAETFHQFATHIDEIGAQAFYGGQSLHDQSHGEAFLSLLRNRFGNKGIYLLDEPESALSPARQLAFLRLLHELATVGESQFIIATHSPIILGYPNASILNFDTHPLSPICYEETTHYSLSRRFLENREAILKQLLK